MEDQEERNLLIETIINTIKQEEGLDTTIYRVPDAIGRNISPYLSIVSDLKWVISTNGKLLSLKNIGNNEEDFEKGELKALWVSAIVIYGRCFTEGRVKLEPSDCFLDSDSEVKKTHDYLMRIRNKFIAHREDTEYEQSFIYFKLANGGKDTQFKVRSFSATSQRIEKLQQYEILFKHVLSKANDKLIKKAYRVHQKLLKDYPTKKALEVLRII